MKTVEIRFTPSEESDNGVAEGAITITGTDEEVQSVLMKINTIELDARFAQGDDVVTADGLRKIVQEYDATGTITMSDGYMSQESELEPWDEVTAVQRYAASFGMKVTVDVS